MWGAAWQACFTALSTAALYFTYFLFGAAGRSVRETGCFVFFKKVLKSFSRLEAGRGDFVPRVPRL